MKEKNVSLPRLTIRLSLNFFIFQRWYDVAVDAGSRTFKCLFERNNNKKREGGWKVVQSRTNKKRET